MPLYLVRHGEAYEETVDPNRSLTEAGKATIHAMAKLAAAFNVPVSQVLHSGKTRARQTAEIFSQYLKPPKGVAEIKSVNPHDDVTNIVPTLDPSGNVMIVGHLPFMERLVSYLTTGETDKTVVKFQTGGIVCLEQTHKSGAWYIKWVLMPKMV
jgi:phosphohistidine phosphatase